MTRLARLLRSRRGTSYTLPVVLVVPVYLAILLTLFELGFVLLAGVGLRYAAFCAARSAAVWQSHPSADLAALRPRQAAWAAVAPFLGARPREIAAAGPVPADAPAFAREHAAYLSRTTTAEHGPGAAPPAEFLERQLLHAAARTDVRVEALAPADPHGLLRVTVVVRVPLVFPVASRLLDPDGRAPFEVPMTATVTLPNEAPEPDTP